MEPKLFRYAVEHGLPTEKAYPYKAVNQDCHARYGDSERTYIKNWKFLGPDENAAAYQLMQLGPIGYSKAALYTPSSLGEEHSKWLAKLCVPHHGVVK